MKKSASSGMEQSLLEGVVLTGGGAFSRDVRYLRTHPELPGAQRTGARNRELAGAIG